MAKPAKPEADADAPAPKSKKKLIIIIAAVVLLAGAGGAAWFFMQAKDPNAESAKGEPAAKAEATQDPKFVSLEPFTVNLQREEHAETDQYLQIGITLKVVDPELEEKVKAVLPEIRSKINLLLSSKHASELVTIIGKKKLAVDIATEANTVLGFHNAPTAPAAASAPVATPPENGAAGEAGEAAPVPAPAPAGEAGANPDAGGEAPAPATPVKAEKKGVVDVMFTSFIIQ